MPSKIVLVAEESLENKDITNYIYNWFKNNTDIIVVSNLLSEEDMNLISEKNYYDIALVNVYAKLVIITRNNCTLFANFFAFSIAFQ